MTTGEKIKQRRLELGMSVDELARKLNKNRATIYRYENNEIENFPTSVIKPLAKVLETTPAYLMGWDEKVLDVFIGKKTLDEVTKITMDAYRDYCLQIKSENDARLLEYTIEEFSKLNTRGKERVLETTRELACNPLYNQNYEIEVAAANKRTDISFDEDEDTSDDDIMNSDDF